MKRTKRESYLCYACNKKPWDWSLRAWDERCYIPSLHGIDTLLVCDQCMRDYKHLRDLEW